MISLRHYTTGFILWTLSLMQSGQATGAIRTALGGAWESSTTWLPNGVPAGGDVLIIPPFVTVTVNANHNSFSAPIQILVSGTLNFNGGGSKLDLPCGSIVQLVNILAMITGNSNGNSQTLRICAVTHWAVGPNGTMNGPLIWPLSSLPVELLSFNAEQEGRKVVARWSTATEAGSDRFELKRAFEDGEERTVAIVHAAGHSSQQTSYSVTDEPEGYGTWYYRLVQVDQDGSINDLGTRVVQYEPGDELEPWPNPATTELFVAAHEAAVVELLDATGRTVLSTNANGPLVRMDLGWIPSGNYLVRTAPGAEPKRIVVTR